MYQYTTPTIIITLSGVDDFALVSSFRVAISTASTPLLKTYTPADDAVDIDAKTISVALTQEETAALPVGQIDVQMRIVFTDGSVEATDKVTLSVQDVLDEVVIDNE